MKTIKEIVGNNLANLRKSHHLTQLELAEKFDYSDKAISKWEKGDTLPDIEVLYKLAEFYGVTLDFLTHEPSNEHIKKYSQIRGSRISIVCLSVAIVWMIATIVFVWMYLFAEPTVNHWQIFVWAIPASCLILFVMNHMWGKKVYVFYIGTVFIWSLIVSIYLEALSWNPWPLFLLGIPAQIILLLRIGIRDSIFHFHLKKLNSEEDSKGEQK